MKTDGRTCVCSPFSRGVVMGVLLATSLEVFAGGAAPSSTAPQCPLTQGDGADPFYTPNAPNPRHHLLSGRRGFDRRV